MLNRPKADLRRFTFLRPVLIAAQNVAQRLGFQLIYSRVAGIPGAEFYGPMFQPWRKPEWRQRLRMEDTNSMLAPEARYYFWCLASSASGIPGTIAECGVYRGGTAKLLRDIFPDRELLLFDTFEGMPQTDPSKDLHRAGDFRDTSLEAVKAYLAPAPHVDLVQGLIPQTLLPYADRKFAFVHIDLDIYSSIYSACQFFYPRLARGGVILFDDYGFASCPGARAAVDDFLKDEPRAPLLLCLPTGQAVLQAQTCS